MNHPTLLQQWLLLILADMLYIAGYTVAFIKFCQYLDKRKLPYSVTNFTIIFLVSLFSWLAVWPIYPMVVANGELPGK